MILEGFSRKKLKKEEADRAVRRIQEVLVVGHLHGPYGRKLSLVKVEALSTMKECRSTTEVRRFLGA